MSLSHEEFKVTEVWFVETNSIVKLTSVGLCNSLDNNFRALVHDAEKRLSPYKISRYLKDLLADTHTCIQLHGNVPVSSSNITLVSRGTIIFRFCPIRVLV